MALSGFMGAGKTTVGERLARSTGRTFVDLDAEIEAAFARPITTIFAEFGEPAFRAMEARLLSAALARPDRVIALGGGAVEDERSRARLTAEACWIHLDVPLSELKRRLASAGEITSRPLWADEETLQRLFEGRAPLYAAARYVVDGNRPPGEVVASIESLAQATDAVTLPGPPRPEELPLRRLRVEAGAGYDIVIGAGLGAILEDEVSTLGRGPIALLTDWNVGPLHADRVAAHLGAGGRSVVRVTLPAGEAGKGIGPVLEAVDQLLDHGWQRSAPVVALGGGVLGDMAGLVASLTLRGVPFVQVPTTLLAMVDSSVGGKVGVNHRAGKNLVGAFWQPSLVVADLDFLDTLPDRELRAGLAEVLKSALLGDLGLLELLETRADDVLARDRVLLGRIVEACCRFKASVVDRDVRESGWRRILNLGHTVGHAIESAAGYGRLLHGEAVAIGLVGAAEVGAELAKSPATLAPRIRGLCTRLGLPTAAPPLAPETLMRALSTDKKLVGDALAWVLLSRPGVPTVDELPLADLGLWLGVLQRSGVLSDVGV